MRNPALGRNRPRSRKRLARAVPGSARTPSPRAKQKAKRLSLKIARCCGRQLQELKPALTGGIVSSVHLTPKPTSQGCSPSPSAADATQRERKCGRVPARSEKSQIRRTAAPSNADIYTYSHMFRQPAETDLQRHFQVSPPSVHQMIVTLKRSGLVQRQPSVARSIQILVAPKEIPIQAWLEIDQS